MSDHERIASAMAFLVDRAAVQPGLEEVAAHVHLSPYHFQRMFCRWAGITPKRFLQALTLERGKELLDGSRSLLEVSHELGLSGSSRLHDHFVKLEAVTPGEYKEGGKQLHIKYGVHPTPLGPMFVAGTNFQIAVWRALLKIPQGALASYSQVARALGAPRAARAVGNAIGANPVALLIPCHRVIQQSGALGGYRWGPAKKLMAQTWERMQDEPVAS